MSSSGLSPWQTPAPGSAGAVPTTQPVESTLRSETHLKLRVQPPLLREQSRTGPKEESKSLMVSKYVDSIASSLGEKKYR